MIYLLLISCRYTSKMLLAAIDENHRGTYDFLYLPIDFKVCVGFLLRALYFACRLFLSPVSLNLVNLIDIFTCGCRINAMWAMHLSTCCHPHLLFLSTRSLRNLMAQHFAYFYFIASK